MLLEQTYKGKKVVVTGATSGNGEALAHRLLGLGAKVIGLGRNPQKLVELEHRGATPYSLDFSNTHAVDAFLRWLISEHGQADYLFHLAGNTIVGTPTTGQVEALMASDYHGPVRLMEGIIPNMNAGGTIAAITSVGVALGNIPAIKDYARVKGAMVDWYNAQQSKAHAQGINLMLVSMGFVNTGIANRLGGEVPLALVKLFGLFIPGPQYYTDMILTDAARGEPVSYPGILANLAPFHDGRHHIHPLVQAIIAQTGNVSLAFCRLMAQHTHMRTGQ